MTVSESELNILMVELLMNSFFTKHPKSKKNMEVADISILKNFYNKKGLPWPDELPF